MDDRAKALVTLGRMLKECDYHFITPTPETHRRVRGRAAQAGQDEAKGLRDVFGYSRPFARGVLPAKMLELLAASGELSRVDDRFQSKVRYASLGRDLFVHSAYPTTQADAVFFGPDTYRYHSLLERTVPRVRRLVDVGAGSGAGALAVRERVERVTLADISAKALRFAEINAELADASCEVVHSDVLSGVAGDIDVVVSNPPYMRDAAQRAYRDGGGRFGEALSVRIVEETLERLRPGGMLILYTGSTIVDGKDTFWERVRPLLDAKAKAVRYEELDPDVFGEELEGPMYRDAERIAAVGLCVQV